MQNLAELLSKFMADSITEVERKELSLLIDLTPDELLSEELETAWINWQSNNQLNQAATQSILQNILHKKQAPVKKLYTRRWMVAASIIILLGLASWWLLYNNKPSVSTPQNTAITKDVPAPKDTRAVITLADGRKVYLDNAGNGILAQQNNVDVIRNAQGEIVYEAKQREANADLQFNTLVNPRGSKQVALTLSDGTKVWLNSESSLKYPTQYVGNTREVEVTGEAYFEVAHDATKPFHVKKGETDITVLGTHFNVNAYDNEEALKVTLLEGSVRVSSLRGGTTKQSPESVTIKPGQQAVVTPNSKLQTLNPDLGKVMAWKNNEFFFQDDDINTIMRQLARWYDIQPILSAPLQTTYTGRITRNVPLSEVLKMFEKIGYVKFEISGNTVRVIPTP